MKLIKENLLHCFNGALRASLQHNNTCITLFVCSRKNVLSTIVLAFCLLSFDGFAAKKDPIPSWNYEVECQATAADGSYVIKVWSYSNSPAMDVEVAKKNAVHAVLFKGIVGQVGGCTSQGPLVKDPATEFAKKDYFNAFFKEKIYFKYVSLSSTVPQVIKTGKKQYKIGYVVSVAKDNLRKDLESAGIIRGLSSGF